MDRHTHSAEISRRRFLSATSAALMGTVASSRGVLWNEAAQRHPHWRGTLHFGTRLDTAGLDSHRHNQQHTSHPNFFLHEVTCISAAVQALRGYQPNGVGALSYRGGGIRTAYLYSGSQSHVPQLFPGSWASSGF